MATFFRFLLLFVQLGLSLAQTTTIDIPFFNISSQPITAAVHWVESSTTVLSFSCDKTTSDHATFCIENSAFPYDALTMAPVLDAMTYSLGEPRGHGYPCWLVPESSSSIAVCDMRMMMDEQTSLTISDIATYPVTITSGMEKLASAALDTTESVLNSALTTLKVPMPAGGCNKLVYASVLSEDNTATVLTFSGRCAPLGDWYRQVLTVGPSTWKYVESDAFLTATLDCALGMSSGAATCLESYKDYPDVKTRIYDSTSIDTLDVTITQAPFAAQTTIEVEVVGFARNIYSITASIVTVDLTATSLSFKLGAGPNHDAFYKQALLFGPSTYDDTYASDRATYRRTCDIYSGGSSAACTAYGSGPDVEGPSTRTYTYPNRELGVSDHVMDIINVTITAWAEKLPAYTATTTQWDCHPSATPGSASTGALPSATDSISGSPRRQHLVNVGLCGSLLLMAALCLM